MDFAIAREIARGQLELATRHLAEGQKRVDRQGALLAELERDGHHTAQARTLLQQFQAILALQIKTRERIVQELAATK